MSAIISNTIHNLILRRVGGTLSRFCSSQTQTTTSDNIDVNNDVDDDMPNLTVNPYEREKKQCILCKYNIEPDYKNIRLLSQFQSGFTGKIYPKNITGLCNNKQEAVEREIKKAQTAGLMGYFTKDPNFAHDPKLFNPDNPFMPHRYY